MVYPGTAKLVLHHLELTHTEEIPKGMVKLVFQLKNSLSKDQHLAKVSCQRPVLTVHNKHGSLLFLVYFFLSLEIMGRGEEIERQKEESNSVVKHTSIFRNCKFKMT